VWTVIAFYKPHIHDIDKQHIHDIDKPHIHDIDKPHIHDIDKPHIHDIDKPHIYDIDKLQSNKYDEHATITQQGTWCKSMIFKWEVTCYHIN